jgi:glycosyltransferase involved in cell wall biosynthesis
MSRRPRILLLIPHLGGGGAERVTEILAKHLPNARYEVHLGLITQNFAAATSVVPASVTIHGLGSRRVRTSAASLLRLLWRIRPNLILSSMAHLNFMVLLLRPFLPSSVRVVVRQNGTVSSMLDSCTFPRIQRGLYRHLYKHADMVICQSQAMADDLQKMTGVERKRTAVLWNPVEIDAIRSTEERDSPLESGPGPHLLAIGRLSHEKGFDLLLQALVEVKRHFPRADLTVAGEGPGREELQKLCSELRLGRSVRFLGHTKNLHSHFCAATVFVLPSRHEGMPNALLEAAAAGLPLVATPASRGLVELLRDQPGAWLADVTSGEALAVALLIALATLRPDQRFAHEWIGAFGIAEAIPAYCRLIDGVLEDTHR